MKMPGDTISRGRKMTTPKWIAFREMPAPGVTKRWEVRVKQTETVIGRISWSNGWRRYVLQPGYPTEWEQDCLRDVADFLESQTAARKAERTRAAASAIRQAANV